MGPFGILVTIICLFVLYCWTETGPAGLEIRPAGCIVTGALWFTIITVTMLLVRAC